MAEIDDFTDLVEKLIKAMDAYEAAQDNPQDHTADTLRELQERVKRAREALAEFIRRHPNIDISGLGGKALRRLKTKLRRIFGPGIDDAFAAAGRAAGKAATGFGRLCGKALRFLGSRVVGGVLDVLLNPTRLDDSVDEEILDEFIVKINNKCFRVTLYRTKYSDELMWSEVQTRTEEIDCPEEVSD